MRQLMPCVWPTIATNQPDMDHEEFLHQFCLEADQAWKDTNDIIFSHQLKYDAQLAAFITTAEGTLQAKRDEIWSCIHSIAEAAGLPNKACLSLALQILEKLPTLPLDLSFCTALFSSVLTIPFLLPDSYEWRGQKILVQLHVQSLFLGDPTRIPYCLHA